MTMPTDTQRAPTREELEAVGEEIQELVGRIQYTIGRDDAFAVRRALIIAIAQAIREAEEPDCYAYEDYSWRADEDLGYIEVSDGVVEVAAYRYVGQRWAAKVPVASDGGERECELCYFDSEDEALAAVRDAARAAGGSHA